MPPAASRPRGGLAATDEEPAPGKLAARTARRIEDDIVQAGWPIGRVLGSEPELIARYGVSRAVFREAVRLVEHHQVGVMRRGPAGGLFVRAPEAAGVIAPLTVYLDYAGATIDDVLVLRIIIEPLAAALAAGRITERGIIELRAILADSPRDAEFGSPAYRRLHLAIARASDNPVLMLFVEILTALCAHYAPAAAPAGSLSEQGSAPAPGPVPGPGGARGAARAGGEPSRAAHAALVDAVVAGNAALAEHESTSHLTALRAQEAALAGRSSRRRVEARDIGLGQPDGFGQHGPKLAEQAAGRIRDDIARGGWPVGAVLGSEGELLDRYGVSRAVLREAVRLLEHHSIAQMRRGPGGGLVVTEPGLTATVDAMALCLEYRHASARDLQPVRDALELASVEMVAQDLTPQARDHLERSLLVDAATPLRAIGPADRVHVEIAALTGNPLLEVFVSVLTLLWRRHTRIDGPEPPTPLAELPGEVTRAHRAIIDAILAGDRSLARHRMSRHLTAMTPWWR